MKAVVFMSYDDVALVIPSRIGSTRLARKALEKIGDKTMIEHVVDRALESGLTNIFVATDSDEIAEKVHKVNVIMTPSDLPSGTDRVYAAVAQLDRRFEYVINLQGDMPFIDPRIITQIAQESRVNEFDITTPVVKFNATDTNAKIDFFSPANVLAVASESTGRALYFSRMAIPYSADYYLYHIGVYGYKRGSLERFVKLPVSHLEMRERLEQLRALENGLTIGVSVVENAPISVDTAEDLEDARQEYRMRIMA